jgi:1-acyl-sn-glycerol-3-phosphate acyltransferase
VRAVGSFLRWSWIYFWGTVIVALQLLTWPVFNPWVDPQHRLAERLNGWWARGVLWAFPGIRIEVSGREWVDRTPAAVLCANHTSAADIIMLLASFTRMKFIAKRPLFFTPPIGGSMWFAGYVIAGTSRTVPRALAWLARGCHILTFPEGTRSPDGRLLRFRQGAFVLAREGGVPVVPVAISGTRQLLGKGKFVFNSKGLVRISFLEPVKVEGDPKRVASAVRAQIQAAIGDGGGQSPTGLAA